MRKLVSFMVVSLDGFYEGPNQEFDWPNVDAQFNEFGISQLHDIDTLLFGRYTYEGMASYWPTAAAANDDSEVAALMNSNPKIAYFRSRSATAFCTRFWTVASSTDRRLFRPGVDQPVEPGDWWWRGRDNPTPGSHADQCEM